ncbi:MAG: hypothetical protein WCP22_04300 [Chlamydiota bacterium]
MKSCRSGKFLRLFTAVFFVLCGFSGAGAFAAGLELAVSRTAFVAGDPISVTAHAAALAESFDAWAVILTPGGQLYSMSLAGTLAPGAVPIARSTPGLPTDMDATLLSMRIPAGIAPGEYTAVLVFLPAGTIPTGIGDAEAKAIPGCFARTLFYVISGRVSIDIDGTWAVTLDRLGTGTMTLTRYDYIVEGAFTGDFDGDASIIGFIDLDTFTLFLNFADKPGAVDMTLKGGESGATISGTYSSDVFDPPSGTWSAVH